MMLCYNKERCGESVGMGAAGFEKKLYIYDCNLH